MVTAADGPADGPTAHPLLLRRCAIRPGAARVLGACAAGAARPALWATEFKPWILFEPDNLKVTRSFLGDFFPPKLEAEFLAMVAREAWRTVAIATAGMALALVLAIPLALASTAVLSVSRSPGACMRCPSWCARRCAGC
jgi:phosphonate transport system permease protein